MRIKISFSNSSVPVPIQNQSMVNSYFHKCLGENNKYHDAKSNYSLSGLMGGTLDSSTNTLTFKNKPYIIVSSLDMEMMNIFILGVLKNQDLGYGMKFAGIDHLNEIFINGWNHFATLSPFLLKTYSDKKTYVFDTFKNENFIERVKTHIINKVSKINPKLDLSDFDVNIQDNEKHKVKKIFVKNVVNYANQCQISINCKKEVAELLYNIGIGQSTGSGFGTIYKTENHSYYR